MHVVSQPVEQYPFNSLEKRSQFQGLLKELRCLVCQNQDLADSNATLAIDLKKIVYDKVQNNQSSDDIRLFLSQRYGDFVLFKPPIKQQTYLLWFGPILFLVIALFWLVRCVSRIQKND
jgi:cytochrome c-type biogenesis protein CcmH